MKSPLRRAAAHKRRADMKRRLRFMRPSWRPWVRKMWRREINHTRVSLKPVGMVTILPTTNYYGFVNVEDGTGWESIPCNCALPR